MNDGKVHVSLVGVSSMMKKLHVCVRLLRSCERLMPKTLKLDHGVRWSDVRATVLRDLLAKHGRGNCGVESAAFFFVAEVKP